MTSRLGAFFSEYTTRFTSSVMVCSSTSTAFTRTTAIRYDCCASFSTVAQGVAPARCASPRPDSAATHTQIKLAETTRRTPLAYAIQWEHAETRLRARAPDRCLQRLRAFVGERLRRRRRRVGRRRDRRR